MAKKMKVSSKECAHESMYSPSMYIDFDNASEIKGLTVGDTVRVVVRGTVKSLEQRKREGEEGKPLSSICIEDFEAELVPVSKDFDALFDDEEDDK